MPNSENSITWADGITADFGVASNRSWGSVPAGVNNAAIAGTNNSTVILGPIYAGNEAIGGFSADLGVDGNPVPGGYLEFAAFLPRLDAGGGDLRRIVHARRSDVSCC
jgi:hypothetical protein